MPKSVIQNLALSVRQPFAEQIMTGKKKIEYRSRVTHIRGRVYIYASKTLKGRERSEFTKMKKEPGDFPTGVLVGTVEITNCEEADVQFEWELKRPKRLKQVVKPKNRANPTWFKPFKLGRVFRAG